MIDDYIVNDKLYTDDYFDLYRGIYSKTQELVSIKLPRSKQPSNENISILKNEYNILKRLDLPGVINVKKLLQLEEHVALILDDIEGYSLNSYINNKPVTLDIFFKLAINLINSISELHQNNIIFNGFNSRTLYLSSDFSLKLTDFSFAIELSEEMKEYLTESRFTRISGYSSPEQTGRINRPVDYRSDLYGIGAILFELLTGKIPFETDDPLELIHYIIAKKAPLVTEINTHIPVIVAEIIEKLLSKMPEERYASILGLKADLIECERQWKNLRTVPHFSIGQKDLHDHLTISHRLYGRKQQVEELLSAYNRTSEGSCELILISGYSGVGKSSLVKEIHKPIMQQHGYFIQGKFDQLRSYVPFNAIVTAYKNLITQILSESDTKINSIRESLIKSLDNLGQVVIDVIPDVELIIGKQPPVPALNAVETSHRFNLIFRRFTQVFADTKHPIVLFLDDLQWADNDSLRFIENLLLSTKTHHLLIIGAYRDNEVDGTHPLQLMLENLKIAKINFLNIAIKPLKINAITKLVMDSFNSDEEPSRELAAQLEGKTKGNPYFMNVFLKMLYHEQLLVFSFTEGKWKWDLERIKKHSVTDNVVDLLTLKIHQLPSRTQKILKLASCFGYRFDLKNLSIVSQQQTNDTVQDLWEAIHSGLIIHQNIVYRKTMPLEKSYPLKSVERGNLYYRFAHDRVQQAAHELIPKKARQDIHLLIGRLLLKENPLTEDDERLFEIMEHFNQSLQLITSQNEKYKLAQYNLWAGIKAKKSAAYQAANKYLQAAAKLLKPFDWDRDYEFIFAINKDLAVCNYLTGRFGKAEKIFSLLLKNSKDVIDSIEIYRLNCEMLSTLNKHTEAITLGLHALKLINIKLPQKTRPYHILKAILKIKLKIGRKKISQIDLVPIKNAKIKAAIHLITQLFNNAFTTDQPLFVLLTCTSIYLSLVYGYSDSNALSLPVYAFVIMHRLNLYQEGLDFVELNNKLTHKYGTTSFEGKNKFILGSFIEPWIHNAEHCIEQLSHAFHIANTSGDLVYANYSNLMLVNTSFFLGKSVKDVKKYLQDTIDFTKKAKISDFSHLVSYWDYAIQILEGEKNYDLNTVKNFEHIIKQNKSKTELCFFYAYSTKLSYLAGKYEYVLNLFHPELLEYGRGMVTNLEYIFYYALSITQFYNKKKQAISVKHYLNLLKIRKQLRRWYKWCPVNFEPYYLIIEGELAANKNKHLEAIRFYDEAIKAAKRNHTTLLIGVATERLGLLYLSKKIDKIAEIFLKEAYASFNEFGATTKCQMLERTYPQFTFTTLQDVTEIAPESKPKSPNYLDMLAILRSTEIISSEIQLDKLRKKLLLIVLEVGGAEHAVILWKRSNRWVIEAEGTLEKQNIYTSQEESVTESRLPLSLLQYVQRTLQPTIIPDAHQSELTLLDAYVQKENPRSLLMLPIFYQGLLSRILYLENKNSTGIFTDQNRQSLQLIASSAMISLENARLYHQASHDPLTGLANRNLLDQIFKVSASQALRVRTQLVFLFLDLDNFKNINDTLGHEIGDRLLMYIAEKITSCLREGDLASRLGGDEFAVLLSGIEDISQIISIADRLFNAITQPLTISGHKIKITSSMGICLYPKDATDIQTLLKLADIALYQAKEKGKNQYNFYSETLQEQYRSIYHIETELQLALEQNEFCIYYQPIIDINSCKIKSFEALLRWKHPKKGLLQSKDFINLLERKSLIVPVSEWIMQTVCQQAKIWQKSGLLKVPIAINTSAVQFSKHSISCYLSKILSETGLDPKYIELELTESTFIENQERVFLEMDALLRLGIKLVIDDFGTGYSSLSYLKHLPVSKLKIDKSFFNKGKNTDFDLIIINSIITLAHQLNLEVIAEGIETKSQLDMVRSLDIDAVQGYYYSYPMSKEECEKFLLAHRE